MTEKERNYIKEYHRIQKERNEKYMTYLKTVTTMAVGFLGIMLSLADTGKMSCIKHLFYSITVTSTTLGILASLIMIFGEIISLTMLRNNLHDKAKELLEGNNDLIFSSSDPKGYKIVHFFWIFFFVVSLVSATLYSWF